uniref:Uncharacterized protein n=1 Tax=Mesocestoides corti TaxID=53468 RepID=A0A5K3EVA4_MESCO
MKKTGKTEQALLISQKPESHFRRRPSDSATQSVPFITYCSSFVSVSGWLPIFLACH